jgi:Ca2+-binding EF-hand superfamily protein
VSFNKGPQSKSGRIWWIYDRAPAGSAPFLHAPIPEDQWADMKQDPKTGSWTAIIPLKEGASRIDFFSNHGHMANGYQQYLSSPYTRVVLSAEAYSKTQRKPAAVPSTNAQAQQPSEKQLTQILKRFPEADTNKDGKLNTEEIQQFVKSRQRNMRPAAAAQPTQAGDAKLTETPAVSAEEGGGPDQETKEQFIKRVEKNTKKSGKQLDKKSIEARFQEMDANQDGIVTREERRAGVKEAPKAAPAAQPTQATNAQAQQPSEEQLARILKRFPEADKDKDGKLNTEEIQQFMKSRQRNRRPGAAAQPTQAGEAKLAETLAGINARGTGQRFKNIELELFEWPSELHEKLGKMKKFAFVARPVEKIAGKLPLIIYLHGGAQRWWDMSLQQQLAILRSPKRKMLRGFDFAELAGKGLIVLEPNIEGLWNADSLDTMLDYVLETFPEIDKDRVYVMGYSMGGKGTWAWINKSADRFAAAAAGGFSGGSDKDNVKKLARLPIWGMAGSNDGGSATGMRKMVERLKAAGNVNVKCTVFDGGHKEGGEGMFSTTVELVDWMLGFSKGK